MARIKANGIEIEYDTFGRKKGRPLVLIMGLGEQMVAWPEQFCRMLADAGFFVIRFDNRDTGHSTKMESKSITDLQAAWEAYFKGESFKPPYTLKNMAADAIGLMDEIGVEKAYACGFSLGGMIAQNIAFNYPERLLGMICMGSSTGELHLPPPTPDAQAVMATPPPQNRDSFIIHQVHVFRVFSGGSRYFDPECRTEIAAQSYDRCFYPPGFILQSVAMLADGSRRERLEKVRVPTLVLHGELDPMARSVHGQAVADAVERAEIIIVPEWGHGLDYPKLWPHLIGHLVSTFL
jgi:pimeloyl-ACP methyl ester carboxylesterase